MFLVHFTGRGDGCGHYIACNEYLSVLPNSIKTFKEAEAFVLKDGEFAINDDEYKSATIYEVQGDPYEVNLEKFFNKQRLQQEEREKKKQEYAERLEYERLKIKFGRKNH
jgi:hypothetical protein